MFKYISTSLLLCTFLSAESFDIFLQKAIDRSAYLYALSLEIKESEIEADISLKYENPTLELTHSSFKPANNKADDGYILNLSQPVRLWGIKDDTKALNSANIKTKNASFSQKKAEFIRNISLKYTIYSEQKRVLELAKEEITIAKKIYEISALRFQNGAISKGVELQALLDYEKSQNSKEFAHINTISSYYDLLSMADTQEETELDDGYDFTLKRAIHKSKNPSIELLSAQKDSALMEAKVNSHAIKSIDIFGEFESEPEQDIFRFGVNIPLAIFNDNKEEAKLSTLRASKFDSLSNNEKNITSMELKKLYKERDAMLKLKASCARTLQTEVELLAMYEDGYKISSINLIELQEIKNKMLQSKRALIEIETALNKNAINTNYIKGVYNE